MGKMEPQFVERDGQRFVKVRVPVIVDADGDWFAVASSRKDRKEALGEVVETAFGLGFDSSMRCYFLYALVPVPDPDPCTILDATVETTA